MEHAIRAAGGQDSFSALTWYSSPDAELLDPLYAKLTHLESKPQWETDALSNRVRLIYQSDANRIEHCACILPAITPKELVEINLKEFDAIFVNMISGYDLTLDTFEWIRQAAPDAHIHLDVHALILGELSTEIGVGRTPRGVRDWQSWLRVSDSVQMNELETAWLGAPEITSEPALLRYMRNLAKSGGCRTRSIIITRAERGATLFDFRNDSEVTVSPEPTNVLETTGSGDVFGSQFVYSLLQARDAGIALRDAVNAASLNTTLVGVEALVNANS
jgi:sugar/nucleoside kinase (ribokinase family)